jgi:hypothetical protein
VKLRVVHAALLLALVVAIGVILRFVPRSPTTVVRPPVRRPLEIVPAGAAFVLSADLVALRASPLARRVFAERLRSMAAAPKGCGLDPVNDLDEIVIAVQDARALGELERPFGSGGLAVVASGKFRTAAVSECAAASIRARGGDPVLTPIGSFVGVRDRKRGGAEIVARDGLLVVSEGAYLRALLDAADGKGAEGADLERTRDRLHGELRRRLGEDTPVRATLSLPPGWLEQALRDPEASASPLSKLRSAAAGVKLGSALSVHALLVSESAADSAALEAVVRSLARDADLGSVSIRPSGVELEVRADVPEAAVEALLRAQAD